MNRIRLFPASLGPRPLRQEEAFADLERLAVQLMAELVDKRPDVMPGLELGGNPPKRVARLDNPDPSRGEGSRAGPESGEGTAPGPVPTARRTASLRPHCASRERRGEDTNQLIAPARTSVRHLSMEPRTCVRRQAKIERMFATGTAMRYRANQTNACS